MTLCIAFFSSSCASAAALGSGRPDALLSFTHSAHFLERYCEASSRSCFTSHAVRKFVAPLIKSAEAVVYPIAAGGGALAAVFGTRYSSHTGSMSYEISLQ